ncbi:MAG: BamA/TamA family outer membrane protein [Ignavibacteria bacterium]|nr:BamA/TamA family outer membrane protein [Ignavibacteria bacterium]
MILYKKKYFFTLIVFLSLVISSHSQDKAENKVFEIDEINISFTSQNIFDPEDVSLLLASKEGDNFDIEIYLQDVERIKKYYFDNGFFNVIVDTGLVFNMADDEVIEKFIITENIRYRYNNIKYSGIENTDDIVKNKIFKSSDKLLFGGRFYSKDTINQEVNRVLNILFNNGYATALSGKPEILKYETNEEKFKNKVDITLIFVPKIKYRFGKTNVTFTDKRYNVSKEDIFRELTFSEDQTYDKSEVINSEINLSKISLIENPRINIEEIDSINNKVNFSIDALIRSKYDFTPELFGYYFQQVFYLGAGISFTDKNFFGGGRVLTSSLRFYFHSFDDNRLEFVNSIYQPFLFRNRNISGTWNIGAEYRLNEISNLTLIKNSFGVTYSLPDYTYINKLTSKWEINNVRIKLKQPPPLVINYFTSTLSFGAIHNSTNNIQFPFKGNYQSYEIEESGLLSGIVKKWFNTATLSYVKFTNFNSAYYNLTNDNVKVSSALAFKFSTGVIFEYGDNTFTVNDEEIQSDRVPNDKKFVCGGGSSVRGWGAKQLGIVKDKNIGGDFILESSVEHRLRPFMDSKNTYIRDLGFAAFIDAGNAWSEIGKFKLNEIAIAAGGGIRYYTIIGAIRFDVGFKIYDPQPGDIGGSNWIFGSGSNLNDKYNFQFGIGNTF